MRNTPQQIPASRSRSSRTETAARSRAPPSPETPSEPISGDRRRPPPPSSSPIPFPRRSISSLSLSPSLICRTSSPRFHESIIQLLSHTQRSVIQLEIWRWSFITSLQRERNSVRVCEFSREKVWEKREKCICSR